MQFVAMKRGSTFSSLLPQQSSDRTSPMMICTGCFSMNIPTESLVTRCLCQYQGSPSVSHVVTILESRWNSLEASARPAHLSTQNYVVVSGWKNKAFERKRECVISLHVNLKPVLCTFKHDMLVCACTPIRQGQRTSSMNCKA